MLCINILVIFICISCVKSFEQNDFTMKFERANLVRFNHEYFSEMKVNSSKYNRTHAVANLSFTLKKDIDSSIKLEIQAYKFMSNEYRYFPIRFAVNGCAAVNSNEFGLQQLYNCGNLTTCTPSKGTYHICNFAPDGTRYPPFIPEGDYMLDLKLFDSLTEIAFAQGYGTIKNKFLHN